MQFSAIDPYETWGDAAVAVAKSRGWEATRVSRGRETLRDGYGFIRLSMEPKILAINRNDYDVMRTGGLKMIQDQAQIDVYENKSAQFERWSHWMPETWRFTRLDAARDFLRTAQFPIVSKADSGASSVNVRILKDRNEADAHVRECFSPNGIALQRGYVQRGYVLLQRCIPHKITYRVNILGNARAVFFRYCYPDRMVAQTGNVEPAMQMTPELESLLEFAGRVSEDIGTKWCALDILKDGDSGWRLLETSEGWPWPSPGTCNEGTIFRNTRPRKWIEMFEVMFDQIEAGVWS